MEENKNEEIKKNTKSKEQEKSEKDKQAAKQDNKKDVKQDNPKEVKLEDAKKETKSKDSNQDENKEKSDVKEIKKEKNEEPKKDSQKKVKVDETKKSDEPKKKKSVKSIVVAAIIIIAIIAIIVYFAAFHRKTIDLSKYIDVTYSTGTSSSYDLSSSSNKKKAYDGYATAKVSFDEDKLKDLLGSKKKAEKFIEKSEIKIENDNNGKLSNGDSVEIKVNVKSSWLKDNRYKLKSEDISVTVEGLEEANVLDLFKKGEFEVEITGVSPNLSISVNNNSSDDFIKKNVTYSTSQSSGLENGDKVTITASYSESKALEKGIVIAENTYEYEIKDQAEYIDSIDNLDEATLFSLRTKFVENVKNKIKNDGSYLISRNYEDVSYTSSSDYTTTEPELVATYLLTRKGSSSSWYDENEVCSIYKVVYTITSTGVSHEWYFVATASNVAIKDSALYNEDDIDYSTSGSWDKGKTQQEAYDDIIDSQKGSYVIEEVK